MLMPIDNNLPVLEYNSNIQVKEYNKISKYKDVEAEV